MTVVTSALCEWYDVAAKRIVTVSFLPKYNLTMSIVLGASFIEKVETYSTKKLVCPDLVLRQSECMTHRIGSRIVCHSHGVNCGFIQSTHTI